MEPTPENPRSNPAELLSAEISLETTMQCPSTLELLEQTGGKSGETTVEIHASKSTTQQQRLFLPVKFELPWTTTRNYLASKDNGIQRLTPPRNPGHP